MLLYQLNNSHPHNLHLERTVTQTIFKWIFFSETISVQLFFSKHFRNVCILVCSFLLFQLQKVLNFFIYVKWSTDRSQHFFFLRVCQMMYIGLLEKHSYFKGMFILMKHGNLLYTLGCAFLFH